MEVSEITSISSQGETLFENVTGEEILAMPNLALTFSSAELIFISTAYSAISLCGIVGNFLVALAVVFSPQLQTTTNVFVVSLSINDSLSCLTMPFHSVTLLMGKVLPDWFCQIIGGTVMGAVGTSALTLLMIAINRWFLITKARHVYARVYNKRNTALMISFVWSYSIFICAGVPYFGPGKLGYSNLPHLCSFRENGTWADSYSLVVAMTTLLPAVIITSACYIDILRYIRRHHRQLLSITKGESPHGASTMTLQTTASDIPSQDARYDMKESVSTISQGDSDTAAQRMRAQINRREIEVTKNLFQIVCAFFCCVLPSSVAFCIRWRNKGLLYTSILLLMNGCVNPFLYAFKHPHYKAAFKAMLTCKTATLQRDTNYTTKMTTGQTHISRSTASQSDAA
ncbi:G-protein coupled receptor moody-like [Diadema setosum]|uniref:G-protein coupled receptor moody-like n=1 Tax=Diadema setosum TaxID=31175 RepID=UPI003B3B2C31